MPSNLHCPNRGMGFLLRLRPVMIEWTCRHASQPANPGLLRPLSGFAETREPVWQRWRRLRRCSRGAGGKPSSDDGSARDSPDAGRLPSRRFATRMAMPVPNLRILLGWEIARADGILVGRLSFFKFSRIALGWLVPGLESLRIMRCRPIGRLDGGTRRIGILPDRGDWAFHIPGRARQPFFPP